MFFKAAIILLLLDNIWPSFVIYCSKQNNIEDYASKMAGGDVCQLVEPYITLLFFHKKYCSLREDKKAVF